MAAQVGVSHTMVGRIWRTFGLKPHRTLSFKLSPDPQLIAKVRDVVGLYMNPPDNVCRSFSREFSSSCGDDRRWSSGLGEGLGEAVVV